MLEEQQGDDRADIDKYAAEDNREKVWERSGGPMYLPFYWKAAPCKNCARRAAGRDAQTVGILSSMMFFLLYICSIVYTWLPFPVTTVRELTVN